MSYRHDALRKMSRVDLIGLAQQLVHEFDDYELRASIAEQCGCDDQCMEYAEFRQECCPVCGEPEFGCETGCCDGYCGECGYVAVIAHPSGRPRTQQRPRAR